MRLVIILEPDGKPAAAMKEVTTERFGVGMRPIGKQVMHVVEVPPEMEGHRLSALVRMLHFSGLDAPHF
jgi:hypothetical protein